MTNNQDQEIKQKSVNDVWVKWEAGGYSGNSFEECQRKALTEVAEKTIRLMKEQQEKDNKLWDTADLKECIKIAREQERQKIIPKLNKAVDEWLSGIVTDGFRDNFKQKLKEAVK